DQYQILREDNPHKNVAAFDKALQMWRNDRGNNFASFVFPRAFPLESDGDLSDANFSGAKFYGRVSLRGRSFPHLVSFAKCEFHERASFRDAVFQDGVIFEQSTFSSRVSF